MSRSPNFIAPIPRRSRDCGSPELNDDFGTDFEESKRRLSVPPLEELIDLCYQHKMQEVELPRPMWDDAPDAEFNELLVIEFERFLIELHCLENLNFLIEIFKYEKLYDALYPDNHNLRLNTPSPKPAMMYGSLGRSVDAISGYKKPRNTPMPTPLSKPASVKSLNSLDHDPASVFASTIDDIGIKEASTNVWDDLMDRELHHRSDLDSVDDRDVDSVSSNLHSLRYIQSKKLSQTWGTIIKRFVINDAHDQINLSNQAYGEIMTDLEDVPSPNSLWRAKQEILQLIKENAYNSFCRVLQSKTEPAAQREALDILCKEAHFDTFNHMKQALNHAASVLPKVVTLTHASRPGTIHADLSQSGKLTSAITGTHRSVESLTSLKSNNFTTRAVSPTCVSPALTPTVSNGNTKSSNKSKGHGRLRHLASPSRAQSPSTSSSPSSLSAILGHLKINTPSIANTDGSLVHTKDGSLTTPSSQSTSLSSSPILLKKSITNELAEETGKHKLRIWRNRKS
jgi:hypothetical protein